MSRTSRQAASFDHAGAIALDHTRNQSQDRPLVIGTIRRRGLAGLDMIRLDASRGTMRGLARLRDAYDVPCLLDLPGASTPRVGSPLTTTELLVFAAAEDFDWVGLRGLRDATPLHRARPFLPPSTRLLATLTSPIAIEESLVPICEAADGLAIDVDAIYDRYDEDPRPLVQAAVLEASRGGKSVWILGDLLPSMMDGTVPATHELTRLAEYLQQGCGGMILNRETAEGHHAQSCIELLNMLLGADSPTRPGRSGAHMDGRPTVVHELPYLTPANLDW